MCNRLINLAYKTDHKGPSKAVLVYLADQVRKIHVDRCFPSVETIARRTGLAVRTVRYALKALEAAGDITRHFRTDNSTLYEVHPGRGCTPAKTAGVQNLQATPANSVNHPCKSRRETRINPKKNREAIPIAAIVSEIVARQTEKAGATDDTHQVDPKEFSALVKKLREQA